jgi:hypothetical protein
MEKWESVFPRWRQAGVDSQLVFRVFPGNLHGRALQASPLWLLDAIMMPLVSAFDVRTNVRVLNPIAFR